MKSLFDFGLQVFAMSKPRNKGVILRDALLTSRRISTLELCKAYRLRSFGAPITRASG
jgi:hypothetical protein